MAMRFCLSFAPPAASFTNLTHPQIPAEAGASESRT